MGLVAKVLSFLRTSTNGTKVSDVKANPGGGANITPQHFQGAGDDTHPLPGDYVALVRVPRSGGAAAVGYLDPKNAQTAQPGDRRLYGRNAGSGAEVCQVWLKSNGSVLISNGNGSLELKADGGSLLTSPSGTFELGADGSVSGANSAGAFSLEAGGDFTVNGVTIDTTGQITSPTAVAAPSIVVNGKEMDGHIHSGVTTGPNNTGPAV